MARPHFGVDPTQYGADLEDRRVNSRRTPPPSSSGTVVCRTDTPTQYCNFTLHPDSDCARVRHWQPAWVPAHPCAPCAPAAGSVMNDDDVVERLIRFNRDREPERLKIKLKNMAADP